MADHPSPVAGELSSARDLCILGDPEQLELIRDEQPGRDAGAASSSPRSAAEAARRVR
jgi:hypothetical protein